MTVGLSLLALPRMEIPSVSGRMASAKKSTGRFFRRVTKGCSRLLSVTQRAFEPKNKTVAAASTGIAWYASKLGAVHAPALINQACIRGTSAVLGNTMGRLVGASVVSPMLTPTLAPIATGFAAIATGLAAVAIFNYMAGRANSQAPQTSNLTLQSLNTGVGEFAMLSKAEQVEL